jgi:hypothetical protein
MNDRPDRNPTTEPALVNHVAEALARVAGWVSPLSEMEVEFVLGYQRRAKAAIEAVDEWRSANAE